MPTYRPPPDILNEVTRLYIDGKSVRQVAELADLTEDKVSPIFQDIGTAQYRHVLSYQLVNSFNKDGRDASENSEPLPTIKLMIDRGVNPNEAFELFNDVAEFCHDMGLESDAFLRAFRVYCRLPIENVTSDAIFMIPKMYGIVEALKETLQSLGEQYRSMSAQNRMNKSQSDGAM